MTLILNVIWRHVNTGDSPAVHASHGPSINEFLDEEAFSDREGMVKLGGRLENGLTMSFDEKHHIVLAKGSLQARLLITKAHKITMHMVDQSYCYDI